MLESIRRRSRALFISANLGIACALPACSSSSDDESRNDASAGGAGGSTGGGTSTGGTTGTGGAAAGGAGDGGPDAADSSPDGSDAGDGAFEGGDATNTGGAPGTGGAPSVCLNTGGATSTGGSNGFDGGCPSLGVLAPPVVSAAIQVPGGTTLVQRFYAVGSQIYTCAATTGTDAAATHAWTFQAPDAILYDDNCNPGATHLAGPTWKSSSDGSFVVGAKIAGAASPTAGNVDWLLLGGTGCGTGVFSSVKYVQRVDTVGGVAPTSTCNSGNVGATEYVPYTAVYYFYTEP